MINLVNSLSVFINDKPVANTISGGDSGANRTLLRQIVRLCKGDVVTIRNWQSTLGAITLTSIAGGFFVNTCATLSIYKLSHTEDREKCKN